MTGAPARFVVGTGRCGSTLLTRMLDHHRLLVGLHEVFTGLDWGRRFAPGEHTGAEVADLLATPNDVIDRVIGEGHAVEEVTYPFDRPGARYQPGDPVPWLAVATLGHLTDDVDALLDDTLAWLRARKPAPMADHYRALFDRLSYPHGWVERSGSSVDYAGELLRLFPDATVVRLIRDGPEVALSMRNHAPYRLAVELLYGGDDLALFGRYWSDQLIHGLPGLAAAGFWRVHTVHFEDLVADPVPELTRIAQFWALPEERAFALRAATLLRRTPALRAPQLDPTDRARLEEACEPGRALLRELAS